MDNVAKQSRWTRLKQRSRADYQPFVNAYALVSVVFILVALLLLVTPLRRYLPGYNNAVEQRELTELEQSLTELSGLVESQQAYIENLKRTILGKAITADSLEQPEEVVPSQTVTALPPSEAEIRLRREMEEARQGQSGTGPTTALPVATSAVTSLAQVYLVAPVNGEISAPFDLTAEHTGVDILAPQHTAIKSVRDGVVFMSEFTSANGNVIGIQHDHNLISFYKHNEQLLKEVGDRVRQGEAIAIIGNTGTQSTGPHLHFELWYDGRAVDPGEYVSF